MGMQSSFVFPICIMASTMMVTEDISSCEDMEPMDSVIAVHIVFLSIRFVRYNLYLCYIRLCIRVKYKVKRTHIKMDDHGR